MAATVMTNGVEIMRLNNQTMESLRGTKQSH